MKTKTKKLMLLILVVAVLVTILPVGKIFAKTDNTPEFTMTHNLIMKRDETSTLDVTVDEKLSFKKFSTKLDYMDDALQITDIEKGDALPEYANFCVFKDVDNTKITGFEITSSNGEPIEINAGEIAKINVKTDDNAQLGKYRIALNEAQLLNDNDQEMNFISVPGSVIIVEEGTNPDKAEFNMVYNQRMFPGEEQTVSVKTDDKMEFYYIMTQLLYDNNIEVLEVTNGKDLPEFVNVIPVYDKIMSKIIGFSIFSEDQKITINENAELANIKIKIRPEAAPEKTKFEINWDHILNQDWNEVISDNTIADIEIMPQVTTPSIPSIEKAYIQMKSTNLLVGEEEKVQVIVEPEEASNLINKIEYTSSNPEIATVNEDGTVKAIAPGKATIKAVINDEFTSAVEVTVTDPDIPNTSDISIELFVVFMVVSAIAIACIIITKNK